MVRRKPDAQRRTISADHDDLVANARVEGLVEDVKMSESNLRLVLSTLESADLLCSWQSIPYGPHTLLRWLHLV